MPIKLIVGLGNPGAEYEQTRHNAGSWFVERLVALHNINLKIEKKFQAYNGVFSIHNNECRLLLPLTFMNRSGISVRAVCQFYRIKPHEILVAHDDLDLEPGRIKLKTDGGHGGHNGLRDIMQNLSDTTFHRLRIGIGHPGNKDAVLNYVLGQPSKIDKQNILAAIERASSIIPTIVESPIAVAMNILNQ